MERIKINKHNFTWCSYGFETCFRIFKQ